jgi:hypothetical protein
LLKEKDSNNKMGLPINMKKLFFAAALFATPASSYSNNDIFLKCNLTYTTLVPSETTRQVVQHYKVETETGKVWVYDDRDNTYINMCAKTKNVKCEISSNSIYHLQDQSDENGKYYSSFSVNRWNGNFSGYTDAKNSDGKSTFTLGIKGLCEAGGNQIVPEKKF